MPILCRCGRGGQTILNSRRGPSHERSPKVQNPTGNAAHNVVCPSVSLDLRSFSYRWLCEEFGSFSSTSTGSNGYVCLSVRCRAAWCRCLMQCIPAATKLRMTWPALARATRVLFLVCVEEWGRPCLVGFGVDVILAAPVYSATYVHRLCGASSIELCARIGNVGIMLHELVFACMACVRSAMCLCSSVLLLQRWAQQHVSIRSR